ncbi:MAG: cell division protein FtsA [Candidatus Moranbacteria bacterium CG_4_8_14_3_um_filter_41_13]|nr:MAG: cell division protein FtsA [Candidatus Moranbacteria bacterium CG2_30_41_165]PIW94388.1 MAG: cell division protein FtsA [Candidatus Moranbacteria bacterium CG_4_8_14_3_um_filter_41_13]HCJ45703.1 cell division protein FtsA [Candidatus Moranbacteria bacterium]
MSRDRYYVGLDIGSSEVRTVIAQEVSPEEPLRVIGVGATPSLGMRRGIVVDADSVAKCCNSALEQAERMAGHAAESVVVSVGGTDIVCQDALGVIAVGRADGEVVEDDMARVLEEVQARLTMPLNREIIHVIPKNYRLDDQKDIKNPVGMKGVRLEMNALVISGSTSYLKNIARSLDQAGTSAESFVVEPLACAESVLSVRQKELGTVLVNIGGSTTSIAVFEDGDLLHLAVLPVGSGHITNDIAIGLRTSIEVAEAVKVKFGSALPEEINKKDEIDLSLFDSQEDVYVSTKHVAEIVEARLEEIFSFVNEELKKIHREGLLPGGVVLSGGGSLLPGSIDLAKRVLRLPSQIGYPKPLGGMLDQVDTPPFSTVVGLLLLAQTNSTLSYSSGKGGGILPSSVYGILEKIRKWLKQFLP